MFDFGRERRLVTDGFLGFPKMIFDEFHRAFTVF